MGMKKYIGTKEFYRSTLALALPIMIQNGISSFVSLLDNLMIGRVGDNALSGVAICNQFLFVFFLVLFGATAGVGIFTAQYHGNGDVEGVRYTFRFKLVVNSLLTIGCILVLSRFAEPLIGLYLKGEGKPEDAAEILKIGKEYMSIILIGMIPIGITNSYAGTLRDIGETRVPMRASLAAIFVNLIGNFILIYGYLGAPKMGASGAALATVISRFVEVSILVIYTAVRSDRYPFIKGAFRHFHVPLRLAGTFVLKSLPLMMNETLWSLGMTFLNQCFSFRSLDAVAALNIESTIWNLLGVAFLAMGEAVGIIVGQKLGKGELEEAQITARRLILFTVVCGAVFSVFMLIVAPFFPMLYKSSAEVKAMATKLIIIYGALMPVYAFTHASYFTIRSGGRTGLTMIFDSCFVWIVTVPAAYILSRFTQLGIIPMVLIVQSLEIIKACIGGFMVHKNIWVRNLVE